MRPPSVIVSGAWLLEHLGEVTVVDSRWYLDGRDGRAAFEAGHIPGAVFVDLDRQLAEPPTAERGRHPLPSPESFAVAMGALGVAEGAATVVYDDAGGSVAARLWWMLHAIGQPVAVLDGGLAAWPGSLESGPADPTPVTRNPIDWPADRFVDLDGTDRARTRPDTVVVDARAGHRYADGDPRLDPRPGHVPGARSAPWSGNLDATTGRFLDAAALRRRYAEVGATTADDVIAYCGSGVTACHDLLAMTIAGIDGLRLFTGSWSAWGASELPNEVGPDRRGDDARRA